MDPDALLAESLYQSQDTSTQHQIRRIILRLVCLDDAMNPLWRTSSKRELNELEPGHETALNTLVQAGIVNADHSADNPQDETIAIISENLIETWPLLLKWISDNRSGLVIQQQAAKAAQAWQKAGRTQHALWDRTRMMIADVLAEEHGDVGPLDPLSREFLNVSAERTHRKPHALSQRHPRTFAAAACVCLIVIAGIVWGTTHHSSSGDNMSQRRTWSQQLITYAEEESAINPGVAGQLALAAYRYSPSQATSELLYKIFAQPSASPFASVGRTIVRISAASNAPLVAAIDGKGKNGRFHVWTVSSQTKPVLDATVSNVPTSALAISPNGTSLAAPCSLSRLCMWNLVNPRHPVVSAVLWKKRKSASAQSQGMTSIAFSPDGHLVAASSEAGETYVWSVVEPSHPVLMAVLPNPMTSNDPLAGVAFSSRNDLLAETIQGGQTRLWNLKDVSRPVPVATIRTGFQSVQFSPDGTMLAAAGDRRVGLWRLSDRGRPDPVNIQQSCTTGSTGSVLDFQAIAFSPHSDQIAYSGLDTTDSDATMCVLNLTAANLSSGSPAAASVPTNFTSLALAYTHNGALLSGGQDGVLRQWRAPLPQIDGLVPATHGASFDLAQGGRLVAGTLSGPLGKNNYQPTGVGLWDTSTPSGPVLEATIPVPAVSVDFLTPRTLLIGTPSGEVQLWDVGDPHVPRKGASLGSAVVPHNNEWSFAGEVTSNSSGTLVSVLGTDGDLHFWQVIGASEAHQLSSIPARGAKEGPAGILPDGRTADLVTSSGIQWIGIADPFRPTLESFTPLRGANVGQGTVSATGADDIFLASGPVGSGSSATYDLLKLDDGTLESSAPLTKSASVAMSVSSDGALTVVGGYDGRKLTIWSTADPGHPRRLTAISVPKSDEVKFNQSHTLMAVDGSSAKPSVQVWNVRNPSTPVLTGTFTPPPNAGSIVLNEQEFSPSGLLFVENVGTLYLIHGSSPSLTSQLCPFLRTSLLTSAKWQQYAPGVPYLNPCS